MLIVRRGKAQAVMTETNRILICILGNVLDFVFHLSDFKLETVLVSLRLIGGMTKIGCRKRYRKL